MQKWLAKTQHQHTYENSNPSHIMRTYNPNLSIKNDINQQEKRKYEYHMASAKQVQRHSRKLKNMQINKEKN